MNKHGIHSGEFDDLRERAEAIVQRRPEELQAMSPEEIQDVVHELQVHQIELELQNEELRHTQRELEAARDRYSDLYDLAPLGYVTLDGEGVIVEANLTAANMLGVERTHLVERPLTDFIQSEDQDTYYLYRRELQQTGKPQGCEVGMAREGGSPFWAHLQTTPSTRADGETLFRVAISDVTERKQMEQELREHREHLEELVEERTERLRTVVNAMAGREVRMADLKKVIKKLRAQLEEAGLEPVADDPLLGGGPH